MIGIAPDLIWRCRNGVAEINHAPQETNQFIADDKPPLASLRALMAESAMTDTGDLPPMAAGLFGYFGYDMIRHIETIPDGNKAAIDMDESFLLRPSLIAIFDRLKDNITLITQIRPADWPDAVIAWKLADSILSSAIADLDRPLPPTEFGKEDAPLPEPKANMTKAAFLEMVEKGKDYIRAGDIFQIVLSQRFSIPFDLSSFDLYRSLRRLNPSPFLFHFDFGNLALVGSSPEISCGFATAITIRPVAGNRKRGATPEEDAANAVDLIGDIKERAEHLMLLDLGRNDVGRVAKPDRCASNRTTRLNITAMLFISRRRLKVPFVMI